MPAVVNTIISVISTRSDAFLLEAVDIGGGVVISKPQLGPVFSCMNEVHGLLLIDHSVDHFESNKIIDNSQQKHKSNLHLIKRIQIPKKDRSVIEYQLFSCSSWRLRLFFNILIINIRSMKKFAINYSRKVADHRVPYDYTFNKQLLKSPSHYLKFLKEGINTTGVKHFHVWMTVFSTAALAVLIFYKFKDQDARKSDLNKKNMPGFRYMVLSQRGGYGAYDNVLQKFQNQEGGIRDLPWNI